MVTEPSPFCSDIRSHHGGIEDDSSFRSEVAQRSARHVNVILLGRLANPDLDQDPIDAADVFLTSVTAAELMYGVARLPEGRRKERLSVGVRGLLSEDFGDQILPFDELATFEYANIVAARERSGRLISMADAQIAGICRRWNAGVATRNVGDFADTGIHVVNPWATAQQ